ncbi:DNA-binding protein [Staphylococcus aureus]|nr:DNA-binding protein [Staphylococcus aureus]
MKTVGEALKGRRERLGMTLTELEQRTGIKREMLVHIENNEFDQLPNKITAKDLLENMQA